jgi:signal transduction histidine kinase
MGIGIPKKVQKVIFDRFVQADLSFTRPYEGSGLGLAIAKAYAELLDGKIWLESEEGKGSTFWFSMEYLPATN